MFGRDKPICSYNNKQSVPENNSRTLFFFHRLFRGKVLYNSKIILKFVAKKEKAFTI